MIYYIKQGQSSIFHPVKLYGNECEIPEITSNIKKTEKIVKKMKKKKIEQVVLNKNTRKNQEFIRILNNYNINVLDGKRLMQYILQDIIDYIKEKNKITNIDEITILSNDLTNEVKQNIRTFAKQYKKIRIVTNHLEKFKRLEEELYKESGISIIITNNKRKALSKSMLIINFDFVQEIINQYNIGENAIIINLSDKIKINKKRFAGIVITDYDVEFKNNEPISKTEGINIEEIIEKQKDFTLKEIIEEKIYSNKENIHVFEKTKNTIKKYNIKVKQLYGINGVVT